MVSEETEKVQTGSGMRLQNEVWLEREREREIGIIWGTDNRGFELSMVSHIRTALV